MTQVRELMGKVPRRAWAGVAAVLAVVVVLAIVAGAGSGSTSLAYRTVEKDPTWLGYLPPDGAIPGISVTGLGAGSADGPDSRRINLAVPGSGGGVALCFTKYSAGLARACPGSRVIGHLDRDVALPWAALVGTVGATDWLALLNTPVPALEDLDYLQR